MLRRHRDGRVGQFRVAADVSSRHRDAEIEIASFRVAERCGNGDPSSRLDGRHCTVAGELDGEQGDQQADRLRRIQQTQIELRRSQRLSTPRSGRARRLCALSGGFRAAFRDADDRVGQPRIASDASPMQLNSGLDTSFLSIDCRLGDGNVVFCFNRRQGTMCRMRSEAVVPFSVSVEANLKGFGALRQQGSPCPPLHILEDPFDLRVELPGVDLAADVRNTQGLDASAEPGPELAAVIGDQEPRRCPVAVDRRHDQTSQICGRWAFRKRLQCDDLPTEAIDDRSDLDLLPQDSDLCQIQVPDPVRSRWMPHVIRGCGYSRLRSALRWLGRLLLQHASDRRPADSDAGSEEVPSDRPSPELGLREGFSDLVNEPPDRVVQPVPRRSTEQSLGSELVIDRPLPVPDCVGVHDEPRSGFLRRPSPEPHDLQDLGSFGRGVVGALMRRLPLPLAPEDRQLPLEQRGVVVDSVPLAQQSHQWRRVIEHPGSGRDRRAHEERGDPVRQGPRGLVGLAHSNAPGLVREFGILDASQGAHKFLAHPEEGGLEGGKADQLANTANGR